MDSKFIGRAIATFKDRQEVLDQQDSLPPLDPVKVKKVRDRTLSYTHHHRGTFFTPEYDFDEIQVVEDVDSYVFRAMARKVNRLLTAGWQFVGSNEETVDYIKMRIAYLEMATNKPWFVLMSQLAHDLARFSNHLWVKARSNEKSPGKIRTDITGARIEPVAGYFCLPFETIEFKTSSNGDLQRVMQRLPTGEKREFSPKDVIHFYTNRKPGFSVGTPELFPALDDIALLRRIEENVEELIETVLFPVFHYKVGSEKYPERFGPDGQKETDVVKQTIEYMPVGGVYVSDHRHEITAVGAEGKALKIESFLQYFRGRVFAALGTSGVDMGEGGTANRSTASTMSKGMMMDVEAIQCAMKEFLEFYVIKELLLEGGYNPLDPNDAVFIKFGTIDKEARRADENQQIQLFHANVRTLKEVRKSIGDGPFVDERDMPDTYFKRFQEPLALLKAAGPNSAASQALAESPSSAITKEGIEREASERGASAQSGEKGNPGSTGVSGASGNLARPANQHGVRQSAKVNADLTCEDSTITIRSGKEIYSVTVDFSPSDESINNFIQTVKKRYSEVSDYGVSLSTVADAQLFRLRKE